MKTHARQPIANTAREHILEELFTKKQYSLSYDVKASLLLSIMRSQLSAIERNPYLKNFFTRQHIDPRSITALDQVPPLPVQMFKSFDLSMCAQEEIVRTVTSSGTTGNSVSRIPLSKTTIARQSRALAETVGHYLGNKRKIFLVIDHEGINTANQEISARTMGVRGLSLFAQKTYYLLEEEKGELTLNKKVIQEVAEKHKDAEVYVFGFTYIIWSVFIRQMKEQGLSLHIRKGKLFHSGGWKKLTEERVSKEIFSKSAASLFSFDVKDVHDFYGMAEQGGVVFIDCEEGNKHVPNVAAVIIRDFNTLKPCPPHTEGLIQVSSVLSDSYYSQAILTEDIGCINGFDDCPCGRKGEYFWFVSRVEAAEIRGCGDTFREYNDDKT